MELTRNAVHVLPEGRLAEQLASGRPLRVKLGIDPTTADIHLGHTVVLQKLREFQDAGHNVVLIVGDFTARVGDPSGRSTQRPVPSPEEIAANAKTYQEQAFKVLDRERTEVRFNSEWLRMEPEKLLGLLATTTVARLLEREDFQKRMAAGAPIAALELLYPLLQGYDSVAVEADIEIGGTDQKFNLLFGRDVQAAYGQQPQSILTMPILVGIDGEQKMSKSLGNYVGVTDPPEEMFGRSTFGCCWVRRFRMGRPTRRSESWRAGSSPATTIPRPQVPPRSISIASSSSTRPQRRWRRHSLAPTSRTMESASTCRS
jgi:tyrosyl-tRNA synthetase